jgi:hypothetical protein
MPRPIQLPEPTVGESNITMQLQAEKQYTDANERLADLRKKLERIQKEIDETTMEASGWAAFLERYRMLLNGKAKPENPSDSRSWRVKVKRNSLPAHVVEILQNKGSPMTLKAIINELNAKGIGADQENFRTILNTALWRRAQANPSRLFVKDDEGYRLLSDEVELAD